MPEDPKEKGKKPPFPQGEQENYAATKGAIVTFTKGLAQELIDGGIRVNCVAPGPVWTPLVAQSFDREKLKHFGKDSPMERPAQPAELAPAYVFLACDESRYVNREVFGVTGGRPSFGGGPSSDRCGAR